MLCAEGLPRQTALLKLKDQPLCLNLAPATAHCNPNRFAHAISPSQPHYPEKVWLLPRVRNTLPRSTRMPDRAPRGRPAASHMDARWKAAPLSPENQPPAQSFPDMECSVN